MAAQIKTLAMSICAVTGAGSIHQEEDPRTVNMGGSTDGRTPPITREQKATGYMLYFFVYGMKSISSTFWRPHRDSLQQ